MGPVTIPSDVFVTFGTATFNGEILVFVQRAGLEVSLVQVVTGVLRDLYDFDVLAKPPAPTGAKVQAGFDTLGGAGKVYRNRVILNERSSVLFGFNFR